jgi:hypothetical protein
MSETNLNDLSKIYQDQIAEKKKDDTYLEPDMKKRQANNEKARKDLMKGPQMKNPHFEEKKLDPVGQEDADIDNDGDVDSSDKYLKKRRKAIGKAIKKESFTKSDWRDSLSEVINDIESKPIKEKKVNNKVKINPTMGEAVEEMGGTLLEEIEVDEFEGIVEGVYDELIEEGYSEDDVEAALEQALNEATVTMGHDSYGPQKAAPKPAERTRDKLKKKAKGFLGKVAVKAYNKAREAKAAATPAVQRAKTSAKRGIRKMAQKVVDRMSEEVVGEAVYGGTKKPEPTDNRMTVTNADKAGNTPAYQAYKAGDKRYKAADHMKEGVRDVDPEKGTAERKARLEKKRGMKLDDHPQYKKEEIEVEEGYDEPKMHSAVKRVMTTQPAAKGRAASRLHSKYSMRSKGNVAGETDGPGPNAPKRSGRKGRGSETDRGSGNAAKRRMNTEEASMSPQEVALQKKKAMIDKMIAAKRMQGLKSAKKSEAPTKAMGEGLSVDDQMRISRDHNRKSPEEKLAANKKALGTIKKVKREKDTRTDAQKMTDATGPRPGSRYRGD